MISVCLASYNGENFILAQIKSILSQLGPNDELLISDDGSTDGTVGLINTIKDSRIILYLNNFSCPIKNFEFLITMASGKFIYLSDQDDIWHTDKVRNFQEQFLRIKKQVLILSNVSLIDEYGKGLETPISQNVFKSGIVENLIKNNFIGCSMAFTSEIKEVILPIPKGIGMHDWWIGLCSILFFDVHFIETELHFYRRHSSNFTIKQQRSFLKMISWRFLLLFHLIKRFLIKRIVN